MSKRTWTTMAVFVATIAIGGSALTVRSDQGREQNKQQALAPDFTLRNLDGERITLSKLRGKVVLLNFWATWCPPCRMEIPDLNRIYSKYKDKGLVILGVSWDDLSNEQIKTFVKNYKVAYPILHGTQSELSQVGKAYAWEGYLPTTYIIDRKGLVREVYVGARREQIFLKGIEPLL